MVLNISSKVSPLLDSLGRHTTGNDVPGMQKELDKFFATVSASDVARDNLFIIRVERPINLYSVNEPTQQEPQSMLNGITDSALLSEGLSTLTYGATNQLQQLLKNRLGPYSNQIVKTGFGDYYDNLMGIANGSITPENYDPSQYLGMWAESVTTPNITLTINKDYQQYSKRKVSATGKEIGDVTIVFRCSSSYAEYKYLKYIADNYVDNENNLIAFPDDNIFPEITVYIYNRQTSAIARAVFKNSIISTISELQFSYENNNSYSKFTATFAPESYKFITHPPEIGVSSAKGIIDGFKSLL